MSSSPERSISPPRSKKSARAASKSPVRSPARSTRATRARSASISPARSPSPVIYDNSEIDMEDEKYMSPSPAKKPKASPKKAKSGKRLRIESPEVTSPKKQQKQTPPAKAKITVLFAKVFC